MSYSRETRHIDDGVKLNSKQELTRDRSAYEKSRDAALKKSPDHKHMTWIAVPEIKEGTFIIAKPGCNTEKVRDKYLSKHGIVLNKG